MKSLVAQWPAQPFSRRTVLAGLASLPLLARAQADGAIRIGQSTAMTGPLGDLGSAMHHGARACFAAVNAAGGVHGRPVELVVKDDGYEVARAVNNVEAFLADRSVLALFNCMGTPMVEAVLPTVLASGVPFFAPLSGALLARPKGARNVFNIRASYAQEVARLVRHLSTVGMTRIGVAYQDNAFGKEVYEGAHAAIEKHNLAESTAVAVDATGANMAAAVDQLLKADVRALLIGLAGKPAVDFIKAVRAKRRGTPLYALSVMSSAATLKALGDDATGMTLSQVVPLPMASSTLGLVRDYLRDWEAAKIALEPSHAALEGYLNARVFTEILRRSSPAPTRAAFIDAAWGLRQLDVGGFEIGGFNSPDGNASQYVDLTMVNKNGRFVR